MREDLVVTTTARRLRTAGLIWRPQVGDWCALVTAAYRVESQAGLWLVTNADATVGWVDVIDAAAQWPQARLALSDVLWLPTSGQMKGWLRSSGYHVSTVEGPEVTANPTGQLGASGARAGWAAGILGGPTPPTVQPIGKHRCLIMRSTGGFSTQAEGITEAEAIAETIMRLLLQPDMPPRFG